MTYCDNCEASLTQTDFDVGYCTQCRTPTKKPRIFIRCECHGREFKREAGYRYHMNTQRKQQATIISKGEQNDGLRYNARLLAWAIFAVHALATVA